MRKWEQLYNIKMVQGTEVKYVWKMLGGGTLLQRYEIIKDITLEDFQSRVRQKKRPLKRQVYIMYSEKRKRG